MSSPGYPTTLRPWRQIASELAVEHDSKRLLDLTTELNQAIEAQGMEVGGEGREKKTRGDSANTEQQ